MSLVALLYRLFEFLSSRGSSCMHSLPSHGTQLHRPLQRPTTWDECCAGWLQSQLRAVPLSQPLLTLSPLPRGARERRLSNGSLQTSVLYDREQKTNLLGMSNIISYGHQFYKEQWYIKYTCVCAHFFSIILHRLFLCFPGMWDKCFRFLFKFMLFGFLTLETDNN